jgi:hypothetical protein
VLKSDLCAKLNLPHVGLTTAGDCVVDARNQTRSARSAVNAARVRCAGNPQWSVVEHIEDLELKLSCDSLANTNILEQRDISEIVRRTIKAVATNVSNGPKGRPGEGTGLRTVYRERSNGTKESTAVGDGVERADRACEALTRPVGKDIGTAVAGVAGVAEVAVDVLILAAFPIGGGEGQAALPSGASGELPAPDEVVDPAAGVVQEHLVLAEGKLIDAAENEELVAFVSLGPFSTRGSIAK